MIKPTSAPYSLPAYGYHRQSIPKGVLGETSKIKEEILEYLDACEQGSVLMALNELADVLGAIRAYCERPDIRVAYDSELLHHEMAREPIFWDLTPEMFIRPVEDMNAFNAHMPLLQILRIIRHVLKPYNLTLDDLDHMRALTENAFKTGRRISDKGSFK